MEGNPAKRMENGSIAGSLYINCRTAARLFGMGEHDRGYRFFEVLNRAEESRGGVGHLDNFRDNRYLIFFGHFSSFEL